ncbi:bifunctional indole-3-glycerol-phosphate synthase TrpC/phosphoribosylanthranilate isomerase TrpF [Corynebacterium diphtheriae bv. mitis]|uniref:bifunctional indole-3-glycerol-phosphate synthase TrpC/phosphoribosylanthranilate isomerase TrpF n=1 Tax=Corynebacterium diphtheriae TaxID=1717 RepID=UPI000893BB1C|nr:bifunctional indole-3-glycerol-phosphate synthase TrpC/phosphoribosylanthranilate isomerase TrpF [Corynebacterium diphtheriae]MBG9358623.1 bifunctional indole-3-glycerol-phosphate synthase TrpC/phosphoribosylanthranilate isomerase TrpF [Corynebacterium diphtheriae bv. mitis]MBG9360987.1 bifunctional indole-3-glycerol-phosphate synthase TrpC/phosphoribosylanthranilate isomerase TrpF [Corynebacterium diphtheriae bv. mitis]MBG9363109.1 bifunctional indole-3-glycerol-phosphate synthase TrpC/phosp
MQSDSSTSPMPTVLESIVSGRRSHLPEIQARISHVDPARLPRSTRSLFHALGGRSDGGPALRGSARFIMECKSSSPSLGMIREDYRPGDIARAYSRYAAGISVLCEPDRFGGDYNHLATVAAATHLPVLCKDFIIHPVQVHAARYFGADAILLMLSVLDDATYTELNQEAARLGLDVLTEVIDEVEVERAIRLGATIFGINHRNLHDLSIDVNRSARLAPLIPDSAVIVSESGIRDNETVRQLSGHSSAFLVGSQLTSQPDVDRAARELVYGYNKVCGLQSPSAAQAARASGAIYGGLIFEESSPRNVSRETSKKIMAAEPELTYIAVSRRTTGWAEIIGDNIAVAQIHSPYQGSIAAEKELINHVRGEVGDKVKIWRAVSMTHADGSLVAEALAPEVDRLVLDTGNGGTGSTFDWARIPEAIKGKTLLAGGIGPDNVTEALAVGCAGLDLNSGLEYPAEAGKWATHKDAAAIHSTFTQIRGFHY